MHRVGTGEREALGDITGLIGDVRAQLDDIDLGGPESKFAPSHSMFGRSDPAGALGRSKGSTRLGKRQS